MVLLDHFHVLFRPHQAEDLPKIMQFIKRNLSRNINFVLGCASEEAINKSLLQLKDEYKIYQDLIESHYELLFDFRKKFITKYSVTQDQFYKFNWLKSYHDHYTRNQPDFEEHLITYIYNNPFKHQLLDAGNYQYVYTNYSDLIDEY